MFFSINSISVFTTIIKFAFIKSFIVSFRDLYETIPASFIGRFEIVFVASL